MGYSLLFPSNSNHGQAWLTTLDQDWRPLWGFLRRSGHPPTGELLLRENILIGSRLPRKDQVRSRALDINTYHISGHHVPIHITDEETEAQSGG